MPIVNRRRILLIAATAAVALPLFGQSLAAFAQQPQPQRQGAGRMSQEDRARLREDLGSARREMYKGQRGAGAPPGGQGRQLSPEERERLRRDLEDANRGQPQRR